MLKPTKQTKIINYYEFIIMFGLTSVKVGFEAFNVIILFGMVTETCAINYSFAESFLSQLRLFLRFKCGPLKYNVHSHELQKWDIF